MKIFIDFDDVLFNTAKFIQDFKRIFARHGVSKKMFDESYVDYPIRIKGKKLRKYDPWVHFRKLKLAGIDPRPIERDISELLQDTSQYVFPDAHEFLIAFDRKDVTIVSYGETNFQHLKIRNSGLAGLVGRIAIVDRLKSGIILASLEAGKSDKNEEVYFLDDRTEQLGDVKKKVGQVKTFLVKRRAGRYNDSKNKSCDFEIKTLWQAVKIIKKIARR